MITVAEGKFSKLHFSYNSGGKLVWSELGCKRDGYVNLFITSDEEITEGDYCIGDGIGYCKGPINKCTKVIDDKFIILNGSVKVSKAGNLKIILTTDESLLSFTDYHGVVTDNPLKICYNKSVPHPSEEFINKFIENLNNKIPMDIVAVEYDEFISNNGCNLNDGYHSGVKVDKKTNTVIVKEIKENWTREEVTNLIDSFRNDNLKHGGTVNISTKLWVEENL